MVLRKNLKNKFDGQFYHEYHLFLSLFAIIKFYDLIDTFLDLKQLFLIFPPNFPNGVSIFTLVDIGRAKSEKIVSTKPSYQFDLYMALLWPLWPLNLNRWLFPLNQLQMIQMRGKNYKILKFWVLAFGFGLQKFFRPFFIFLRSLMLNPVKHGIRNQEKVSCLEQPRSNFFKT